MISPLCSSLNKNAARALQSSVYPIYISIVQVERDERKGRHTLPTPVGPKNKNDATGRLGACSPAREIRTASLIADTTWSCPTTLAARDSSIYTKPSVKPGSTKGTRKRKTTHMNQLIPLPLQQILNWNPCSLRHHPRNIVRRHPIM